MRKKPNRAYVWAERILLGAGMTLVAAVIDRLLVRTLRSGSVKPAPRTAAGPPPADGPSPAPASSETERHAVLTPPAKKVADEAGG
jgi:hypothetical protein